MGSGLLERMLTVTDVTESLGFPNYSTLLQPLVSSFDREKAKETGALDEELLK